MPDLPQDSGQSPIKRHDCKILTQAQNGTYISPEITQQVGCDFLRTDYLQWMKNLDDELHEKEIFNLLHSSFSFGDESYNEIIEEAFADLMIRHKSHSFMMASEVYDWQAFLEMLQTPAGPEMEYIHNLLFHGNGSFLAEWLPGKTHFKELKYRLLENINRIIDSKEFYDREIFGEIVISEDRQKLPDRWFEGCTREYVRKVNRALFESVFPGVIARSAADMESNDYGKPNSWGLPCLKEKIARRYGVAIDSIVISNSASSGIYLVCKALLKPGDHVIVEYPCYEPLIAAPESLGAKIDFYMRKVGLEKTEQDEFDRQEEETVINIEALISLITPKTRLIILTNPYNPGGDLLNRDELMAMAAAVRTKNPLTRIFIDEIYMDFVPEEKRFSSWFLKKNEIIHWKTLVERLIKSEGIDRIVSDFLDIKCKIILSKWNLEYDSASRYDMETIIHGLNRIIENVEFTRRCREEMPDLLDERTKKLIYVPLDNVSKEYICKLNRLIFQQIFSGEMVKNPEILTAFNLGDIFITAKSLSKVYGLSKLGCGWIIADRQIVKKLNEALTVVEGSGAHLSESLGSIIFDRLERLNEEVIAEVAKDRVLLERELETLKSGKKRITGNIPEHGCIFFPRISGVEDTDHLTGILAEEPFKVYVVPGKFFGAPGHIRIGYGVKGDENREKLKAGLIRLVEGIEYYFEKFVEVER